MLSEEFRAEQNFEPPCFPSEWARSAGEMKTDTKFYVLKIESHQTSVVKEIPEMEEDIVDSEGIVYIFGVDTEGRSIALVVKEFYPYFYMKYVGNEERRDFELCSLKLDLNSRLNKSVKKIEDVEMYNLVGYKEGKDKYVRVYTKNYENGYGMNQLTEEIRDKWLVYETQITVKTRFANATGINPGMWIETNAELTKVSDKLTNSIFEFSINYSDFKFTLTDEPAPNLRILYLTQFLNSERKPITVSALLKDGEKQICKTCFAFGDPVNVENTYVFPSHVYLSEAFAKFVRFVDPDIIISPEPVAESIFRQDLSRRIDRSDSSLYGRVSINILEHLKYHKYCSARNIKDAAHDLLKIDISTIITPLPGQKPPVALTSNIGFREVEALLKISETVNFLQFCIEYSKVMCVSISSGSTPLMMEKLWSKIYDKCNKLGYVVNRTYRSPPKNTNGGLTFTPTAGCYKDFVASLDFESLYPSIMIAKNMCFSTYLNEVSPDTFAVVNINENQFAENDEENIVDTENKPKTEEDFLNEPDTPYCEFVPSETRKGILPLILEELVSERKEVKEAIKNTNDEKLLATLNCKQIALKQGANSVYGFTCREQLGCQEFPCEITHFGRVCLKKAKKEVENLGYETIYGDTDSLFIVFKNRTINEAIQESNDIAAKVTTHFPNPVRLRLDGMFKNLLIYCKKKYLAAIYDINDGHMVGLDTKGQTFVRSNETDFIKETGINIFTTLIVKDDFKGALQVAENAFNDLFRDKVEYRKFIITSTISKEPLLYKSKNVLVEVANKHSQRTGLEKPHQGDMVRYIVFASQKPRDPLYAKADEPVYGLKRGACVDFCLYAGKLIKLLDQMKVIDKDAVEAKMKYLEGINKSNMKQQYAHRTKEPIDELNAKCRECRGGDFNDIECLTLDCEYCLKQAQSKSLKNFF